MLVRPVALTASPELEAFPSHSTEDARIHVPPRNSSQLAQGEASRSDFFSAMGQLPPDRGNWPDDTRHGVRMRPDVDARLRPRTCRAHTVRARSQDPPAPFPGDTGRAEHGLVPTEQVERGFDRRRSRRAAAVSIPVLADGFQIHDREQLRQPRREASVDLNVRALWPGSSCRDLDHGRLAGQRRESVASECNLERRVAVEHLRRLQKQRGHALLLQTVCIARVVDDANIVTIAWWPKSANSVTLARSEVAGLPCAVMSMTSTRSPLSFDSAELTFTGRSPHGPQGFRLRRGRRQLECPAVDCRQSSPPFVSICSVGMAGFVISTTGRGRAEAARTIDPA